MCRSRDDAKRTNSILCSKFRTPDFDKFATNLGMKPDKLTVMDCITLCQVSAALNGSLGATKWVQEQSRDANTRRSEAEIKYLEAKTRATDKMAETTNTNVPEKIEIVGWDTGDENVDNNAK